MTKPREQKKEIYLYLILGFVVTCFCFDRIIYIVFSPAIHKSFTLGFSDIVDIAGLGIVLYVGIEANKKLAKIAAEHAIKVSDREFLKKHLNNVCDNIVAILETIIKESQVKNPDAAHIRELITHRLCKLVGSFLDTLRDNEIIRSLYSHTTHSDQSDKEKEIIQTLEDLYSTINKNLLNIDVEKQIKLLRNFCWQCTILAEKIQFYINSGYLST